MELGVKAQGRIAFTPKRVTRVQELQEFNIKESI